MNELDLFIRFATPLAIGFFIGLQREFQHGGVGRTIPAGERTFALITLSGALAAMASEQFDQPLIFFGLLLSVGLLVVVGYVFKAQRGHFGMTTEAAILVSVLLGGLCYWGFVGLAVAIGVATTVLLSIKWETDKLVEALTRQDIIAALQFAAITAIILPVLPNESLLPAPFDVLNPFQIWLMVVFISGISFLGYLLIKLTGSQNGIGATGVLGGLVSSTAVTLSFARRSIKESKVVLALAVGISAAWAIMFARIIFQIAVIHSELLSLAWLPLVASGLAGFVFAAYLIISQRSAGRGRVEFSNPFDLGEALRFGLLYAFILVIARSAQLYMGDQGVLLSSFVSGLADVNAITISLAQLSKDGILSLQVAAQGVVIAAITNTLFKGLIVFRLGSPSLRRALTPGLLAMLVIGIGVVALI
ncbi:MAG: MgtC/SapB family protein [Anaerolineales bacterium]